MATWKGSYRFEKAPEIMLDKAVNFEMHVDVNDGSFSGKFMDEEFATLTELEATVTGFFEENYVSFVVTYPFRRMYKQDDGTPVLLTDETDQEVTFYAEFTDDSTKFLGNWEIIFETHIGYQGINLVAASGPFELSLSEAASEADSSTVSNTAKTASDKTQAEN